VGERLAFIALNETYGMESFRCKSPSYKSMEVKDNKVELKFNDTYLGFTRQYGFEGFEIAGADKVFHKATYTQSQFSWFTGELTLTISSDEVKEPVAVRYCFKSFQIGNLKNMRGLPVVPFRTDK
jgi:sialate O-acetylesterase